MQIHPANSLRLTPVYPFLFPFFMSIFRLLLDAPDEPQTYSLASESRYHQPVCTLSTTSPPTHLIDRELMRGHPPVPLWSVWRSCSRAVPVPRQMRQRRWKAQPIRAEVGTSRANPGQPCTCPGNWDTAGGTVLPRAGTDNTQLTGESRPSDLYRGIWHR